MKVSILVLLLMMIVTVSAQELPSAISGEIEKGNFTVAQQMMRDLIAKNQLDPVTRESTEFEIDRLNRIRRDFSETRDDVVKELKNSFPDLTDQQMLAWEENGSLEMKVIDGEKRYFSNAASNLLRINRAAHARSTVKVGESAYVGVVRKHVPEVVAEMKAGGKHLAHPVKFRLNYSLTVKPNAVPDGEVIRCWLPYPREGHGRQRDIQLISTNASPYVLAPNDYPQRTLYMEKKAVKDVPTKFEMALELTGLSERYDIFTDVRPDMVREDPEVLKKCTSERPPHIVFTKEIQELSRQIVGEEKDPLRKAKAIFAWISGNIPWASALEYSTIPNISAYCVAAKHGDCGIQTMLFMTLCRYNGIPAKWQSGWMLHPGEVNLHDWCEIYVDRLGWVPVDQSFGLQRSENESVRYYYLGGIDSYRLIVNDDFGCPLWPAKVYPRSETVDFQRGEVEWRGGNLYFDKWRYHMDVAYEEVVSGK